MFGLDIVYEWLLISLIPFSIQWLFCIKAKRIIVKCIPLLLLLPGIVFVILNEAGVFGLYFAAGDFGYGVVYLVDLLIEGLLVTGFAGAWIMYWVRLRKRGTNVKNSIKKSTD